PTPRSPRSPHRRGGPDRFPARQVWHVQPRRLPGVRGRSPGGGQVEELEGRLLRRAARLVDPTRQARHPEGVRPHYRFEGGVPTDFDPELVDGESGHEDRSGVRTEPEEISTDCTGHARSLHAAKVTTSQGTVTFAKDQTPPVNGF